MTKADPILGLPTLKEEGRWYAGNLELVDSRVSPKCGDLRGLPAMLLLTGTNDVLNADAHRLNELLSAQSAPLKMSEYPNMVDVWAAMPIPEVTTAIAQVAQIIRSC